MTDDLTPETPKTPETSTPEGEGPKQTEAETIRLDQFLKLCGAAQTGGHAKVMIQGSKVQVNGEVETRRRRKLIPGDEVEVNGEKFVIYAD